jgi:peptidoglycan/xylan/chitin deacetylase (PgdA/CDA1 family)
MLTVSNYHYIREDFKTPFPSIFGVTPEAFQKQLLACKEIGEFIHPRDLLQDSDDIINSNKNYILVTFDDGLREQFEIAKPILESLNIPALFFVNSINFIGKKVSLVHKIHLLRSQLAPAELMNSFSEINSETKTQLTIEEKKKAETHYNFDDTESAHLKFILNFKLSMADQSILIDGLFDRYFDAENVNRELYMTEAQLKTLADKEMLGSHAHSHLPLGYLEQNEIKTELEKPKQYLESLTTKKINFVSYPYGSPEACTHPVSGIAADLDYKLGFTMERGINTGGEDKLRLKRFDCNDLPLGKNEKAFRDAYSLIYK